MATNDFIFITNKMIEQLKIGYHKDSFDRLFNSFINYCGNNHVHISDGEICVPDDVMISIYETTNWDETELEGCLTTDNGDYYPLQSAIINPTNYILQLSGTNLYDFVVFLKKFIKQRGLVIFDGDRAKNIEELKEKIGKSNNLHVGFLYLTDSFINNFKCYDLNTLNRIIYDYEYHMNNVYVVSGGYCDLSTKEKKEDPILNELYKNEETLKRTNQDASILSTDMMIMAWDVSDYHLNTDCLRSCLKETILQEFSELGGIIYYNGTLYRTFEEFKKFINKITNKN